MPEINQEENKDIISVIKEYITTKLELTRLTVIERLTVVVSGLITFFCVMIAGILTFLFASFTLAFYLGELLNSNAAGFGIVALLYLLIALTVNLTKEKYIHKFLQDLMVKMIFNKNKDNEGKEL